MSTEIALGRRRFLTATAAIGTGALLPTGWGQIPTASAAPAVGYYPVHVKQQETLIDEALTGRINPSMNRRTSEE